MPSLLNTKPVNLTGMPTQTPLPIVANGKTCGTHKVTWVRLSTAWLLHYGAISQQQHSAIYGCYNNNGGNNQLSKAHSGYVAQATGTNPSYAAGVMAIPQNQIIAQPWLIKVLGVLNQKALLAVQPQVPGNKDTSAPKQRKAGKANSKGIQAGTTPTTPPTQVGFNNGQLTQPDGQPITPAGTPFTPI